MKSFSKSTILGFTFGVLLAAYSVFVFTPPTTAPPGGSDPVAVASDDLILNWGTGAGETLKSLDMCLRCEMLV